MRLVRFLLIATLLTLTGGGISAHEDGSTEAVSPSTSSEAQPTDTTQAEEAPTGGNLIVTEGDSETFSVSPEDVEKCGGPCPTKRPPKPTGGTDWKTTSTWACSDDCEGTSTTADHTTSSDYETSPTDCDECESSSSYTSTDEYSTSSTYCDECESSSSYTSSVDEYSTSSTYCDENETSSSYTSADEYSTSETSSSYTSADEHSTSETSSSYTSADEHSTSETSSSYTSADEHSTSETSSSYTSADEHSTSETSSSYTSADEYSTSSTYLDESESSSSYTSTYSSPSSSNYESPSDSTPIQPVPTYCDVCPTPSTSYTPPPDTTYSPPQPTCDSDCSWTTSVPPPPIPTETCPPRPDCKKHRYNNMYQSGSHSGSSLVEILLQGYDDCANVDDTVKILQEHAPSYPTTSDTSPSLYCRQLGLYVGYLDSVNQFEKKCTVKCRDDGKQIGSEAAYLLCNLPTARIARVDLCQVSFDAGCALAFEDTIRTYCPNELNTYRYDKVKDTVCAYNGPKPAH